MPEIVDANQFRGVELFSLDPFDFYVLEDS